MLPKGTKVYDQEGQVVGHLTGARFTCQCGAYRHRVRWLDKTAIYLCTESMIWCRDGVRVVQPQEKTEQDPPIGPKVGPSEPNVPEEQKLFEYLRDHLRVSISTGELDDNYVNVNLVLKAPSGNYQKISSDSFGRNWPATCPGGRFSAPGSLFRRNPLACLPSRNHSLERIFQARRACTWL
jgi:hypothetical protein